MIVNLFQKTAVFSISPGMEPIRTWSDKFQIFLVIKFVKGIALNM